MSDAENYEQRAPSKPPLTPPQRSAASQHTVESHSASASGDIDSSAQHDNGNSGGASISDLAAEIASLKARLAAKDEQERRNELRFETERRYVREQAFDNRVSLGQSLQVPVSAIKPAAAHKQSAQRRLALEQQQGVAEERREYRGARVGMNDDGKQALDDQTAMERAIRSFGRFLPTFYGNSDKHKDGDSTVDDFVTKVESALADALPNNPGARLSVIRLCLKDDALDWFNRKMEELLEAGIERPDWEKDMRAAFIDAYNPRDTYALRLFELKALRLGVAPTRTPAELASRFDSIVRRMYPGVKTSRADDQRLAGDYADIICNSDEQMWTRILTSGMAVTLQQWKLAVAQQWHAKELIRQREASQSGSGNGRGAGKSSRDDRKTHDESAQRNGQQRVTTSSEDDEAGDEKGSSAAVNAMSSNRGSSSGRGGRQGGSFRDRLDLTTAERRQRFIDGQCLGCGKPDHVERNCKAPRKGQ
jgi:hypothetical protein